MSDMIEKVARAIAKAEKWDNISEKTLSVYRPLARAAIEAIRKPSKEMERAGCADLRAWGLDEADENDAACCFISMIDSALSQDTHSLPSEDR